MKPHFNTYQHRVISHFQIERDRANYDLLKVNERLELQRKLSLLSEFVDFNAPVVLPYLIPLFVNMETIEFLLKNHSEIKRKFNLIEIIEFGKMYRLTKQFYPNVGTLAQLKQRFKTIVPIESKGQSFNIL